MLFLPRSYVASQLFSVHCDLQSPFPQFVVECRPPENYRNPGRAPKFCWDPENPRITVPDVGRTTTLNWKKTD